MGPMTETVEQEALAADLAAWLGLHEDPGAGARIHEGYASDAPLWRSGALPRAADYPAVDFAREFAERVGVCRPVDLRALGLRQEGGDRRVAWLTARDAGSDRPLVIAVGYRLEGAAWRIGWLTLASEPADWGYDEGRLQAIADYGFAEALGRPRSWLDVAFHRLHGHDRPSLEALAGARYACHADTTCCSVAYKIQVSPAAQAVLDAIPWEATAPELKGVKLPELPNGLLLVKEMGERCRFLDEQRRCRVHGAAGRSVFTACTAYPFAFTATPDGVAVSATAVCGSVRSNLGPPLTDRVADLHGRLAMLGTPPAPARFHLAQGVEVDWAGFKEAEAILLATLAREDLPLRRRLWLACEILEAGLAEELADVNAPYRELSEAEQGVRGAVLAGFLDVADVEVPSAEAVCTDEAQVDELRWLLANLLFSKEFSFAHDLRTALHVNVLAYAMARRAQLRFPDGKLPGDALWRLSGFFWHQKFAGFVEKHPEMFGWLRQKGFGSWMLAGPFPE